MKQVLILGGGFAGIQTAIELQKSRKFKVTLISDRDYLYIYPISIWVPVRHAKFEDVQVHGFSDVFAIGDIAAIDGPEWIAKQGHMWQMRQKVLHRGNGTAKIQSVQTGIGQSF